MKIGCLLLHDLRRLDVGCSTTSKIVCLLLHDLWRLGVSCPTNYEHWMLVAPRPRRLGDGCSMTYEDGCGLLHDLRRLCVGCPTTYEDCVLVAPRPTKIKCWLPHDLEYWVLVAPRKLGVGYSKKYEDLYNVAINNIEMREEWDYHGKNPLLKVIVRRDGPTSFWNTNKHVFNIDGGRYSWNTLPVLSHTLVAVYYHHTPLLRGYPLDELESYVGFIPVKRHKWTSYWYKIEYRHDKEQ